MSSPRDGRRTARPDDSTTGSADRASGRPTRAQTTRPAPRILSAERKAEEVLVQLAVRGAPVPVEHLALQLGLSVERAQLGDDVSGILVVRDGRGLIGVNTAQAPTRQRFSIAHEIGHFLLHRNVMSVFIDKQFTRPYLAAFRDATSATGEDKREREANAFAAALLMPERFVRNVVTDLGADADDDGAIALLAKRFEVSQQAMTFRLVNLLATARS